MVIGKTFVLVVVFYLLFAAAKRNRLVEFFVTVGAFFDQRRIFMFTLADFAAETCQYCFDLYQILFHGVFLVQ